MAKTIDELKAQGAQVKNATVVGENTATRVGTLFTDIIEYIEQVPADGTITTKKIAPSAITTEKIANGAVTGDKIAAGTITEDNIADKSLSQNVLANNAVNTNIIQDGAVTTEKLANSAMSQAMTTSITDEARARVKADEQLNNAIVAEKNRAEAAEKANAQAITDEVARAQEAEQANHEKIIELEKFNGNEQATLINLLNTPASSKGITVSIFNKYELHYEGTFTDMEAGNVYLPIIVPKLQVNKTYTLCLEVESLIGHPNSIGVAKTSYSGSWAYLEITTMAENKKAVSFTVTEDTFSGNVTNIRFYIPANASLNKTIKACLIEGEYTAEQINWENFNDRTTPFENLSDALQAKNTRFDNSSSTIISNNVQDAIEELSSGIEVVSIDGASIIANSLIGKKIEYTGYLEDSSNTNVSDFYDIEGASNLKIVAYANTYGYTSTYHDILGHIIGINKSEDGYRNKTFTYNNIPINAKYIRICYDNRNDAPLPKIEITKLNKDKTTNTKELIGRDKSLRFCLITDTHYTGTFGMGSDNFTEDERLSYLLECIKKENAVKPFDFIISTGDTLATDNMTEEQRESLIEQFNKVFLSKIPCPIFSCVGNHDGELTEDEFIKCFGHSRRFTFETDTFVIVGLDQMHHTDGSNAYVETNPVKWHNVGIDYDYLGEQVALAKSLGKDIIVCFHFMYDMINDDSNAINTFYDYCHTNGIRLMLFGHTHVAENWNSKDNAFAANANSDLWMINAGWFANRKPYPNNKQPWSFSVIEINEGLVTSTNYVVAHSYNSSDGYALGDVAASSNQKIIKTLFYYPIKKAQYQLWKFRN